MRLTDTRTLVMAALAWVVLLIAVPAALADPPADQASVGPPPVAASTGTSLAPAATAEQSTSSSVQNSQGTTASATGPADSIPGTAQTQIVSGVSQAAPQTSQTQSSSPPTNVPGDPPAEGNPAVGQTQPGSTDGPASTQPNPTQPQVADPGPAGSSSAAQTISQVQSLGCTAHCQGTSQSQSAQQANTTIHAGPPDGPIGAGPSTTTSQPNHGGKVTQIQLGCIAHCFGSSTVAGDAGFKVVQHLGDASAPPDLPTQDLIPAAPQTVVGQSSYQNQEGLGSVSTQSQSARQTNVSVPGAFPADWFTALSSLFGAQGDATLPSLPDWIASLGSSSSSSPSSPSRSSAASAPAPATSTLDPASPSGSSPSVPTPTAGAFNQVEQAIWQLQVGCLVFCSQTSMTQQAAQLNTTVFVVPSGATASSDPIGLPSGGDISPSGGDISPSGGDTSQLVWQLQIGCLFWCYDAIETQLATIIDSIETLVLPGQPGQPSPSPAPGPSPPPGGGGSTTPPGGGGSTTPPGGGGTTTPPGGSGSTTPPGGGGTTAPPFSAGNSQVPPASSASATGSGISLPPIAELPVPGSGPTLTKPAAAGKKRSKVAVATRPTVVIAPHPTVAVALRSIGLRNGRRPSGLASGISSLAEQPYGNLAAPTGTTASPRRSTTIPNLSIIFAPVLQGALKPSSARSSALHPAFGPDPAGGSDLLPKVLIGVVLCLIAFGWAIRSEIRGR